MPAEFYKALFLPDYIPFHYNTLERIAHLYNRIEYVKTTSM